ncbi:MAG: hypothetical protein Q8O85_01345 [Rhodoferax sp.]|nr:hypothetical protein [Rhodoferax sp.]MDP2677353.1 hypothetical protein [Rhodoferax sp.]
MLDQPMRWSRGLAVLCASEVPVALKRLHEHLGQTLSALDFALDTQHIKKPAVLANNGF